MQHQYMLTQLILAQLRMLRWHPLDRHTVVVVRIVDTELLCTGMLDLVNSLPMMLNQSAGTLGCQQRM